MGLHEDLGIKHIEEQITRLNEQIRTVQEQVIKRQLEHVPSEDAEQTPLLLVSSRATFEALRSRASGGAPVDKAP